MALAPQIGVFTALPLPGICGLGNAYSASIEDLAHSHASPLAKYSLGLHSASLHGRLVRDSAIASCSSACYVFTTGGVEDSRPRRMMACSLIPLTRLT
ncbi:uncharacterized protein TrAFT101_004214 [Trichoderma asperellum]|uniref:Uncharacterized protein n=1 Tax=Trichoderma asperellum (strain ATCC 204424 / CBS 433.97 / NBRC 101777) TaxID=1042311 RepID=A0A2T3ZNC7_TRIA4|nr:hypothetical protein M441DRAFT_213281 [Trichoderma asperellum CBS 433.97]PTB46323.1 hypothetical protein M441DRAFT_213281 [Trichoderma asperellum CBS 433.97]UKZ88454.1 hypothetical protein TrAFT101_004214 [Trichoderma asperellum]